MTAAQALTFARCIGFLFRAPGFSHPSVPPSLRASFAYVLALLLAPGTAARSLPLSAIVPACLLEVALGAALGVAMSAVYDGAYSGGRLVDDYVGIRISVPSAGIGAGAGFGRLWSLGFTAMFFALGAYVIVLRAFASTLVVLPVGSVLGPGVLDVVGAVPAVVLRSAIFVAGPALVFAFAAQIALAIIARIVPRFSTFPLTFPVVLGCALLATIAVFPLALLAAGQPWVGVWPAILP